jgi:hypothetical protein
MAVLQAVIDDSGRGQPPNLVLAGCILDTDSWSSFTDLWQAILDEPPTISYFKMKEANSRTGEFFGFSAEERDKKLWQFISALLLFDCHAVCVSVDTTSYAKHFRGRIGKAMDYPTFLASLEVVGMVMRSQSEGRIPKHAPVTYVFDDQGKEADMFLYLWSKAAPALPPSPFGKELMPLRPAFKEDKTFLPLQAADLLAWHYRYALIAEKEGVSFQNPFWDALQTIPCEKSELDDERLSKLISGIQQNAEKEGWIFEPDLPEKYRRLARRIMAKRAASGRTGE